MKRSKKLAEMIDIPRYSVNNTEPYFYYGKYV